MYCNAQYYASLNYVVMNNSTLLFYSDPIWFYHSVRRCISSGSSPGSDQQYHRNTFGRLQDGNYFEKTSCSESTRHWGMVWNPPGGHLLICLHQRKYRKIYLKITKPIYLDIIGFHYCPGQWFHTSPGLQIWILPWWHTIRLRWLCLNKYVHWYMITFTT